MTKVFRIWSIPFMVGPAMSLPATAFYTSCISAAAKQCYLSFLTNEKSPALVEAAGLPGWMFGLKSLRT
jgi:hypothetical protein